MTDPEQTIAKLMERFPNCFDAAAPRPLAIGIFHDLRKAAPEIAADDLSAALAAYARTDSYLKAMASRRAARVNLSGEPVAAVSKDDAERARRTVAARAAR
jgi:sRNA-binding protein